MNNPQQPREYDAVLGGNSLSLEGAAVLGGIEGVKLRLQNPDAKVRIAALEQALNYGEHSSTMRFCPLALFLSYPSRIARKIFSQNQDGHIWM
jgi:hypothetical protein